MAAYANNARDRSRSPPVGVLRRVCNLFGGSAAANPMPEQKMRNWAQVSGQRDQTGVRQALQQMKVDDFTKSKMTAVFTCPRDKVAEKIRLEMKSKGMPEYAVQAVTDKMGTRSMYEKADTIFDHSSGKKKKGESKLVQYALWCQLKEDELMEVSLWCIVTTFTNGQKGTTSKADLDTLKDFMESECRDDVLYLAQRPASIQDKAPEQRMVAFARKRQQGAPVDPVHEDELINKMEITGFEKFKLSVVFECPAADVTDSIEKELTGKGFPPDVVNAIKARVPDMAEYKKMDKDLIVNANEGESKFYEYAIWCVTTPKGDKRVSMICVAARFSKKEKKPATHNEIEVVARYLNTEACFDVLKVHAAHKLQK
eukprot:TRINITY_DN81117_c0_g1_i1.p1 TRINITY_DN81117_c0_g1~~TRINITY_DN81117_c0_g1_i1.p1  ORF type:complete len:370 (-),score=105.01 TRINITY_DN81117_c0_g1_i1:97-1206(-)